MLTITNENNHNNYITSAVSRAAGLLAGYGIYSSANFVSDLFYTKANVEKLKNPQKTKQAYNLAFLNSKVKEKGTKLFFVPLAKGTNDLEKMQDIKNIISDIDNFPKEEEILNALYPDSETFYSKLCDKIEKLLRKNPDNLTLQHLADWLFGTDDFDDTLFNLDTYISIKFADNAMFSTSTNSILVPDSKINTPFFHELGHSINYNLKKGGKFISNLSRIHYDLAIALGVAAILLPSQKDKEKKNKPIEFLQNNVGKLAFLAASPLLIEEGTASIRGLKAAKPYLDKVDYKKFKSSYLRAFMGYFSNVAFVAGGAVVGLKVKNLVSDILNKKLQKPFFAKEKSCTDSAQSGEQNNINKTVGAFSKRQGYIHSPKTAKHGRDW